MLKSIFLRFCHFIKKYKINILTKYSNIYIDIADVLYRYYKNIIIINMVYQKNLKNYNFSQAICNSLYVPLQSGASLEIRTNVS